VPLDRRGGSLRPCTRFSGQERLVFLPSGSSVVLEGRRGELLFLGTSGGAGSRARSSGSAAGNSDCWTAFFCITCVSSVRASQEGQYISVLSSSVHTSS
jgi:hypothetical protein